MASNLLVIVVFIMTMTSAVEVPTNSPPPPSKSVKGGDAMMLVPGADQNNAGQDQDKALAESKKNVENGVGHDEKKQEKVPTQNANNDGESRKNEQPEPINRPGNAKTQKQFDKGGAGAGIGEQEGKAHIDKEDNNPLPASNKLDKAVDEDFDARRHAGIDVPQQPKQDESQVHENQGDLGVKMPEAIGKKDPGAVSIAPEPFSQQAIPESDESPSPTLLWFVLFSTVIILSVVVYLRRVGLRNPSSLGFEPVHSYMSTEGVPLVSTVDRLVSDALLDQRIPLKQVEKYVNVFKSRRIFRAEQMDDSTWAQLSLPPVIETELRKKFAAAVISPRTEGLALHNKRQVQSSKVEFDEFDDFSFDEEEGHSL